jgi:Tol biopolymer transport system component
MYPSFYGKNFLKGADIVSQGNPEKFLISSDRDGVFDIYELDLPVNSSALDYLFGDTPKSPTKISINSTANDHMPFVYGDMLVFASDRAGGFGGYDLYYSMKTGSGWSEPVNFGPNINSTQDEYRPVVSDHRDFSNRLMIFSSNRPGGLGGFDLYFVGIPKI